MAESGFVRRVSVCHLYKYTSIPFIWSYGATIWSQELCIKWYKSYKNIHISIKVNMKNDVHKRCTNAVLQTDAQGSELRCIFGGEPGEVLVDGEALPASHMAEESSVFFLVNSVNGNENLVFNIKLQLLGRIFVFNVMFQPRLSYTWTCIIHMCRTHFPKAYLLACVGSYLSQKGHRAIQVVALSRHRQTVHAAVKCAVEGVRFAPGCRDMLSRVCVALFSTSEPPSGSMVVKLICASPVYVCKCRGKFA